MVYIWLNLSRPWWHKQVTSISDSNSNGSHCSYITFSLLASTYGLVGSSLWSVDRGRDDLGLVYRWFHALSRYHPRADSYTVCPFLRMGEIPPYIGRWLRLFTAVWRTLPQPYKVLPPDWCCNWVFNRWFHCTVKPDEECGKTSEFHERIAFAVN